MSGKKSLDSKIREKYLIITALLVVVVIAILGRASYVSFVEGSAWREKGALRVDTFPVPAVRGDIYSSDRHLMATSEYLYRLYIDFWANGMKIDTLKKYIGPLSVELNKMFPEKSAEQYQKHIMDGWKNSERKKKGDKINFQPRNYKLLDRPVNYIQWIQIAKMPFFVKGPNSSGLKKDTISMRVNPYGSLALRTIGSVYANKKENGKIGISGLENYYDSLLRGEDGTEIKMRVDGRSQNIPVRKPVNGKDIITTIDIGIQDITEKALVNKLREIDAESGTALVMEVATGEIKAISNMGRVSEGVWGETRNNYAVSALTEPGSTFKVVSMVVALEDGLVNPTDSVNVENGVAIIAGERLEDAGKGHTWITATQAIQYSSNIGVSKLIMKAYGNNPSKYVDGIYRIGLNRDMHLEVPGYAVARIKHPKTAKDWSRTSLPWMSFGYETQIPPIYTLTFFNAIANNGVMVKPLFVKAIQENGETVEKRKPQIINERIGSENTMSTIKLMLDSVVNGRRGTGKAAKSNYVRIAGKTGTAQISHGKAGYTQGGKEHQVTFCGFFPVDKPQYSCIVVIRSPRTGGASGGGMCGPVFKEIAEEIYAQNKLPNTVIFPVDTIHPLVPKVKSGMTEGTHYVLDKLDIAYQDSLKGRWTTVYLQEEKLTLKDRNISQDMVPNVVGMGAKDAVFALENAGLKVSLFGRGTVTGQSVAGGTKVSKGQVIALTLK